MSHLSMEEGTTAHRKEVHGSRCIVRCPRGVLYFHMSISESAVAFSIFGLPVLSDEWFLIPPVVPVEQSQYGPEPEPQSLVSAV